MKCKTLQKKRRQYLTSPYAKLNPNEDGTVKDMFVFAHTEHEEKLVLNMLKNLGISSSEVNIKSFLKVM